MLSCSVGGSCLTSFFAMVSFIVAGFLAAVVSFVASRRRLLRLLLRLLLSIVVANLGVDAVAVRWLPWLPQGLFVLDGDALRHGRSETSEPSLALVDVAFGLVGDRPPWCCSRRRPIDALKAGPAKEL